MKADKVSTQTTQINPHKLADLASQKASAANTPQTHKMAADAHDKAAMVALADGKTDLAKKHRKVASGHRKAAFKAKDPTDVSDSSSPDDLPETDEPDHDGKDENPLKTWVGARSS
jgi:hypothetical protein